ncbi:MAG: hypothetical protein ACOCZU_01205 [Planctomycetota bacterium]
MILKTTQRVLAFCVLVLPAALLVWAAMPASAEDEAHEGFRKRVVRDRGDSAEKARDRKRDGDRKGEGKGRKRDGDREGEGKGRKRDGDGGSEEGRFLKELAKAKVDLAGAIVKAEKASGGKAVAARYVNYRGKLHVLVQMVTKTGRRNAAVDATTGKVRLQKGRGDAEGEGGPKGDREGDKKGEGNRKGDREGDREGEGRKKDRDREGEG